MDSTDLQKQSFKAGLTAGRDPATPYGIQTPHGLDSVAFAAGLIEGRAYLRRLRLQERELDLVF